MANLPEEVLVDILSRLTVESLVRFKCVCRSWYSLFNNPDFVSKHMIKQSKENAILLRYCPGKGSVFSFLSNVDDVGENDFCIEDVDVDLDSKLPYSELGESLAMHGHCNGVVALSGYDEVAIVCNPATREFRMLPKSYFHPFPKCSGFTYPKTLHAQTHGVGFGYDLKTDDYKVVRIVAFWVDHHSDFRLPFRTEVFSLRASSRWREIKNADIGAYFWGGNEMEQFFDGVYYWQGQDNMTNAPVLVSFNMAVEVFSKAPFPEFCQEWHTPGCCERQMTCLGVFNNESIAMFIYPFSEDEPCIEVWVMKEFGLKEFWSKQLTIGPLPGLKTPLLLWKNDKELLQKDDSRRLFSYNLATLEERILSVDEGAQAATYKKTLVSVKAREDIAA